MLASYLLCSKMSIMSREDYNSWSMDIYRANKAFVWENGHSMSDYIHASIIETTIYV